MNPFIPPRNLPLPQERMTIIPATRGGLDIDAGATPYTPPFVEAEGGPEPEQEPNSGASGAFFELIQKEVTGGTATFLQGGQATGGDGNILVDDTEVVDKDGAATSPDGHSLWLKITGTAITADGVLMPGFDVDTALTEAKAAESIPDNIIPTAADPDGTRYVLLGTWADGAFIPSSPGNVQINHCPGSLSITRF